MFIIFVVKVEEVALYTRFVYLAQLPVIYYVPVGCLSNALISHLQYIYSTSVLQMSYICAFGFYSYLVTLNGIYWMVRNIA